MRSLFSLTLVVAFAIAALAAQTPNLPAFDAASVKPFTVPAGGWAWHKPDTDPQHLRFPGAPLRFIIMTAYGLNDYQLTGVPSWADNEFYTINATTAVPTPPGRMLLMLRRLLAERFQLKMTGSEHVRPVYALEVAPGGPKLKPLKEGETCDPRMQDYRDQFRALAAEARSIHAFTACSLDDLVTRLNRRNGVGSQLGRPVVDKTGLSGRYSILVWQAAMVGQSNAASASSGSSLHTYQVPPLPEALEKELGLELVPNSATVVIYKVEHVSRPGPD